MTEMNRRDLLRACGMSVAGLSMSGWMSSLAQVVAAEAGQKRRCVLLWMPGGPSQTDTFDMKSEHKNGGEFKEIDTTVEGIRISATSSLRLPGKFISAIPIKIVSNPCPGNASMITPAISRKNPRTFLKITPQIHTIGRFSRSAVSALRSRVK